MARPIRCLPPLCASVLVVAALAAPFAARVAHAHGVGMSQLQLHVDGALVEGEWDLNLRDARLVLGLDPQLGGEAGWRDLKSHEADLRARMLPALAMTSDGRDCTIEIPPAPMEWNPTFSDVRLHLVAHCPLAPAHLGLHDELLFDLDPAHRAYFSIEDDRVTSVGVLRTGERSVVVDVHQFHLGPTIAEFIREGARHIWSGPDHMLFLIALLLPAPLLRVGRGWSPRPGLWPAAREVSKVVTAFTLAHSLTLCLSFFRVVTPPSQAVEIGIAVSVFAAAWNNLRPFLPGRSWVMALGFGLIHGLGFAGALSNLSLPRHARGLALGSFNVGVEIGQLAIVLVVLPLLYAGSRRGWYPRVVMGLGSLAIAWMAIVWVLERALGFSLLPGR